MGHGNLKMHEVVYNAKNHQWSIPEFQRGFVWKTTQVRDLAKSLYNDYPIGSMLLWDTTDNPQTRGATDGQQPLSWVVDGQQRTTALCSNEGKRY